MHTDIAGPIEVLSKGGARYFTVFVEDKTSYGAIEFLKSKDEVYDATENFLNWSENQQNTTVKKWHCDNSGENTSDKLRKLLCKHGIDYELTVPNSPFQNGRAER